MESILSEHDGGENDTFRDFDSLYDTKALRIMRVLIPFFPVLYQPLLVVWLRFSQFQYAVSLMNNKRLRSDMMHGTTRTGTDDSQEQILTRLLHALKPCLSESEYRELARIQNMFSMFQRFQQIAPYLSALSSMSGDPSAADMMNVFSAMQNGNNSASDIINAFSAMGGGDSAADIINAFSAMQGADHSTTDAMTGMHTSSSAQEADVSAANAASETQASSPALETDISAANAAHDGSDDASSSENQNIGVGMNLDRILDLISFFQTSSAEADTNTNTTERQDEPKS